MGDRHRIWLGLVLLVLVATAQASASAPFKTEDRKAIERFDYRLSYSGLLTTFIWKDLADVSIFSLPEPSHFNGKQSCNLVLTLSTENYTFAELFHPVRYRWQSTTIPDLTRTLLVEESDKGNNDEHNVTWMDWSSKAFKVYRKREKKQVGSYWDEEYEPHYVWETTDNHSLPSFLSNYPLFDGKYNYFIHKKDVKGLENSTGLDPLAMIYAIRRHDFTTEPDQFIDVTHDNEINSYHAHLTGVETLTVDNKFQRALRIAVTNAKKEKQGEGQLYLWLSDDERRIPIRFEVDVPMGKMRVKLVNGHTSEERPMGGCIDSEIQPLTLSSHISSAVN